MIGCDLLDQLLADDLSGHFSDLSPGILSALDVAN